MSEDSGNIKVVVRCRPLNARELARGAKGLIQMQGNQTILSPPDASSLPPGARQADKEPKTFAFDKSYWSACPKDEPGYASQQTLYDDLGRDLLDHAFNGFNTTIFAYGQTGSGKSYSMMGYGADRGIIPLVCQALFDRIESQQSDKLSYTVEVSYLEIYQERVRDLLNPKNKGNLKVREHPSLGPYVEDLSKLAVTSFADIEGLMDEGNKARTVGATQMNETSSRSHALFTLMLTQRRKDDVTGMSGEKVSRIGLVDLAGSERANSTGATGQRLKEGAQINKSLTTLGKVIAALAQASMSGGKGKRKDDFVPYRDSVLTWLLKDSLGGNSKTAMIAAISPADYEETLSTLRYADQAKKIKNKAVVNEDPNAKLIRELKEELATLRNRMSGAAAEATYDPSVPPEKQIVQYQTKTGEIRTVTKAELQDQLEASEKLMADVAQTWEEKLARTQQVQKEREAALEALGIVIEKNLVGVQTPKKVPHLVNLAEDPLADGCLLWMIKPGRTTVGNVDSDQNVDIRLTGDNVMPQHCYFETTADGSVQIVALSDSTTLVNGQRISSDKPKALRSGYRIILGWHAFRFNHPEEVRKTREKSEASSPDMRSPHMPQVDRLAGTESPMRRSDSPAPPPLEAEADWSFARREAVMGRLAGQNVDLAALTDNDLDQLYAELTRARQSRRGGTASIVSGRESRMSSSFAGDDDDDSTGSISGRPVSGSTWTDDTSLQDTALSLTGSASMPEALRQVKEELEGQLEAQRVEYEEKLRVMATTSAPPPEVIHEEREQMEQKLQLVQSEMQHMLDQQRQHYESKVQQLRRQSAPLAPQDWPSLTPAEISIAQRVVDRWRTQTRIKMAEDALTHAVSVKEANVIAHELGKRVSYQLTVLAGSPHTAPAASAVEGITGLADMDDGSDTGFDQAKPCIAVKVFDRQHNAVYLWSLNKLITRLISLRNLYSYIDKPQSAQHLDWDEPFYNSPAPQYSHLGTALVSLAMMGRPLAFSGTATVYSRHSSDAVATCRITIKPTAIVPPSPSPSSSSLSDLEADAFVDGSRISFEITVDRVRGLDPDQLSSVHCQVRSTSLAGATAGPDEVIPSPPFDVDGNGETSLRLHRKMAVSVTPPVRAHWTDTLAPIDFFGRIKPAFIDRLEQHDQEREAKAASAAKAVAQDVPAGRRNEVEFVQEQRHDVSVSIQICELAASGKYEPVPLIANTALDPGAFYLRQGLQRRLVLKLSHSSGRSWSWTTVSNVQLGDVRLLDGRGLVHGSPSREPTTLRPMAKAKPTLDADGHSAIDFVAPWDSGTHDSPFLNRPTATSSRALLRLSWTVDLPHCEAVPFELDIGVNVQSRDARGPGGFMSSFFGSSRTLERANALFAVIVTPAMAKSSTELWRRDTSKVRVRGEEVLLAKAWRPRGVSLIEDYEALTRKERQLADVAATRALLVDIPSSRLISASAGEDEEEKLQSAVALWQKRFGPEDTPKLMQQPTLSMATSSQRQRAARNLVAKVQLIPRSTPVAKRSYLSILRDPSSDVWTRRFAVLRRPYLHLYEASNELNEVAVLNTSAVRVESSPEVEVMLGRRNVFAMYTASTSLFVQAESESMVAQWMRALDISSV